MEGKNSTSAPHAATGKMTTEEVRLLDHYTAPLLATHAPRKARALARARVEAAVKRAADLGRSLAEVVRDIDRPREKPMDLKAGVARSVVVNIKEDQGGFRLTFVPPLPILRSGGLGTLRVPIERRTSTVPEHDRYKVRSAYAKDLMRLASAPQDPNEPLRALIAVTFTHASWANEDEFESVAREMVRQVAARGDSLKLFPEWEKEKRLDWHGWAWTSLGYDELIKMWTDLSGGEIGAQHVLFQPGQFATQLDKWKRKPKKAKKEVSAEPKVKRMKALPGVEATRKSVAKWTQYLLKQGDFSLNAAAIAEGALAGSWGKSTGCGLAPQGTLTPIICRLYETARKAAKKGVKKAAKKASKKKV